MNTEEKQVMTEGKKRSLGSTEIELTDKSGWCNFKLQSKTSRVKEEHKKSNE